MKFWITVSVGIVVISAVGSATYVLYPGAFGMGSPPPIYAKPIETTSAPEESPQFEADRLIDRIASVRQGDAGDSRFVIRNDGKGDLELKLGSKNCSCTAIRIDKLVGSQKTTLTRFAKTKKLEDREKNKQLGTDRDKIEDAEEGAGNINPTGKVVLKPGETADFVMEWSTADDIVVDKVVHKRIEGEVLTNDPRREKTLVMFVVELDILPELVINPGYFNFGKLLDDEEHEYSLQIYSVIHDDLHVDLDPSSTSEVQVQLRPMTTEEKQKVDARSGYVATAVLRRNELAADTEGNYHGLVKFKTNLEKIPERAVSVTALVYAPIVVDPGRIGFEQASQNGTKPKTVEITAAGLGEAEALAVDENRIRVEVGEQGMIQASIRRRSPTTWRLEIGLKPTRHVGAFRAWVPVMDSKGQTRATVLVDGVVQGSSSP